MEQKQIYDVQNLKLRFKTKKALEIKTLKFHNGLIYGICGNFGSGKTSLLKVLAGETKETSGTVLYQGNKFKKGFFGKIKKHQDIHPVLEAGNLEVASELASGFFHQLPSN